MTIPRLPAEPVHLYKLQFWTVDYFGLHEHSWTYYLHETPCHEVVPYAKPGTGVPYRCEWYTGNGRISGWRLKGEWDDCHLTREAALATYRLVL
jgi:hypothetical protein